MLRSCSNNDEVRGFTLLEIVVVMGIFMTLMLITAASFKTIVNSVSQQQKSVEAQIEGVVGLEVLRADLVQAGFGLPWTVPAAINYNESVLGSNMPAASYWQAGDPSATFNDAPSGAPRAILSSTATNFNKDSANVGANYIVIKATSVGTGNAAKKWTNYSFVNRTSVIRTWADSGRDFKSTESVIAIKNVGKTPTTDASRDLMLSSSNAFYATFNNYRDITTPSEEGDTFQLYGVSSGALRMPFNRADYYLMQPTKMPEGCAPGTGVLYKSNIAHSGGGYAPVMPLLDCVADLQIVYGLDTDAGGRINLHTSDINAAASLVTATAAEIRAKLKEIRVYVLVQDGKMDRLYTNSSRYIVVGEVVGGNTWGRTFDLQAVIGTNWQKYRWKVYSIVVRPTNLIQ